MKLVREAKHKPATLLPPPLIYAMALFGAWWLDSKIPMALDLAAAAYLAWFLIALAGAGFVWSLWAVWGHRTTVNPYKAATHLVTSGPYRYSRNPIYAFDWLVYIGVTLLMQSVWPLLFAPLVWGLMRYAVIAHEEAHLKAKFGAQYLVYRRRVRRWL